ncbi:MAG: hypothetical protein LBF02_01110 [Mycoplasmataceae bacterium]|jgi:F0F1-type ATP synthase epsilon subunit|nr:hypothetical protein [Mycoplasmataceae bacterium]
MVNNFFKLKIMTPNKNVFYQENIYSVTLKTIENESISIFANFQNTISLIDPCNVKIVLEDGKILEYFLGEGMFEFSFNTMNILISFFTKKEEDSKTFYSTLIKKSRIKQNYEAKGQNEWIEEIVISSKDK